MSTNRMQIYKSVFLMTFIVFFPGCFFPENLSCCLKQGAEKAVCDDAHQEQLSSADSFLRIEMISSVSRSTNRFHFNSLLAVLLKIAVIPSAIIIYIVAIVAERRVLPALWRILHFVHDSDGKKEMWTLRSSI